MVVYDGFDRQFVLERAAQYRDQLERYQQGRLSEDEFKPLRLQNGWYIQRHAPMLRVAVPWGELAPRQLRMLAHIARKFDRGYAHLTTRQNLQFNWIALDASADVMDLLAQVDMHGIQTSGNCVRNITADPMAGIAPDEIFDVRPYAELIRQWSTVHPEFSFLPRKFKIAMNGAREDRAALQWHDIGLQAVTNDQGEPGFAFYVGGGMGRTPVVAPLIKSFVPVASLLTYLEAVLRVYNLFGRRDNIYKARIKILVRAQGDQFIQEVEREYLRIQDQDGEPHRISDAQLRAMQKHFVTPAGVSVKPDTVRDAKVLDAPGVFAHQLPGYVAVLAVVKGSGLFAGDITADQLDGLADLTQEFSAGEIRVTREQNFLFPWVRRENIASLQSGLKALGLNQVLADGIADVVCCPGGDFCALANARSIPVEQTIQLRLKERSDLSNLGSIDLNISGCINSCGHHHSGQIGILGVDKDGQEFYQIALGGSDGRKRNGPPRAGKIIGASFSAVQVPLVVEQLLEQFVQLRRPEEALAQVIERVGVEPFKDHVNQWRSEIEAQTL